MEKEEGKTSPESSFETRRTPEYLDGQPGEITASLDRLPEGIKDKFRSFWNEKLVSDPEARKALVVGCLGWQVLNSSELFSRPDLWDYRSVLSGLPDEEKNFAREVRKLLDTFEEHAEFSEVANELDLFLETAEGKKFRSDLDKDLGCAGQESKVTREFFSGLSEIIKSARADSLAKGNKSGEHIPMNLDMMVSGSDFIDEDERHEKSENFLNDPLLKELSKVNRAWIEAECLLGGHQITGDREKFLDNQQVIATRNLALQEKPINEDMVRQEVRRVMKEQAEYGKIPLFKERQVLFLTHEEERFNDPKHHNLAERIKADGSKDLWNAAALRQKGKTNEEIREEFLTLLENSDQPLTVVFNGHGGKYDIGLSNNKDESINYAELYAAYNGRQEKLKSAGKVLEHPDIFINLGCQGADFIRNFMTDAQYRNKLDNIPIPIFISESEYGQYAWSEGGEYGDPFFKNMFPENGSPARLKDIIENDPRNPNSNPSIYIPSDEKGEIRQLSQSVNFPITDFKG